MVFMRVCQKDRINLITLVFEKGWVRRDQINARCVITAKSHTDIDQDPAPVMLRTVSVGIKVHADLTTRLVFGRHVGNRRRVFTHKHCGQAGDDAVLLSIEGSEDMQTQEPIKEQPVARNNSRNVLVAVGAFAVVIVIGLVRYFGLFGAAPIPVTAEEVATLAGRYEFRPMLYGLLKHFERLDLVGGQLEPLFVFKPVSDQQIRHDKSDDIHQPVILQFESTDTENNRVKVLGNMLPPMPEVFHHLTVRPNRSTETELQKRAKSTGKWLK